MINPLSGSNILSQQKMIDGVAVETTAGPRGFALRLSDQLYGRFDKAQAALWMHWCPRPRACFNARLLADLHRFGVWLRQNNGIIHLATGEHVAVRFIVVMSDVPNVFNLGGDLDKFCTLIATRDREGLLLYGSACVDVLYSNYSAYDLPLTTISLVQGEALGGGFEAALSSDLIVAEKQAHFGFPEILFNLFPGMGAYSFVGSRLTRQTNVTQIISSGEVYPADAMLELGLIDHVVGDGTGEREVTNLMHHFAPSHGAIFRMRRVRNGLEHGELQDIVEGWVETAMQITERDLRLMQALVKRQGKLGTPSETQHTGQPAGKA
ncbi:MAG: crotonase/enoyl-CoA hydratase family protein [Betaproteobacteria bacterium]